MIAVIGLGYVGLPLAVEFARHRQVLGFDVDDGRVSELRNGYDRTNEVAADDLATSTLLYTCDPVELHKASTFIITVPTPIDEHMRPDLGPLLAASETVARVMSPGAVVVYESTVYPGCTEEDCVPVLESHSGLRLNEGFTVGYSPERVNPGDRQRRLADIPKVVSGSTQETLDYLDSLYSTVVRAGLHRASSIRVAEAAKVIENTQRDLNIALVNELSVLFGKLGIDTHEVLAAAGTKWNFLPFKPGLVGGHCIGVDPYYLTHKAQQVGHHPEVILAGRRINDSMGAYVADQVVLRMARKGARLGGAKVLVMGLAFKENCPDIRNTRVIDIIDRLREYGTEVVVHDPWVDSAESKRTYGISLLESLDQIRPGEFEAVVVAVAHTDFSSLGGRLRSFVGEDGVIFDVKGILDDSDGRL